MLGRLVRAAIAATLVSTPVPPSGAQSLGDVARREADRRATVREAGKVYTNGDLRGDSAASRRPSEPTA
ncbi:MAG: hypothetical protein OEW19_14370, partial [Acidobacteriota bacterium]|nr:hypothetical protein [Acidobacteriota bacterium]